MRLLLVYSCMSTLLALVIALAMPLITRAFFDLGFEPLFDGKAFNISPVFALGLILVLAIKFWAHEPDEPVGEPHTTTTRNETTAVGWMLALAAGIAVGVLASQPVAWTLCGYGPSFYCQS